MPTPAPPMLSMVVPAYNESRIIRANALTLANGIRREWGSKFELIIVDNGSTDATLREARAASRVERRIRVIHLPRRGLGGALREGFASARGPVVMWYPADLSIDLRFVHDARAPLARAPVVIGSRRHPQSRVRTPLARKMFSTAFGVLVRLLFGLNVDTQCVKAYRRAVIAPLLSRTRENGILFELELLALLSRARVTLTEIPITAVDLRRDSKIRLTDSLRIFLDLLALRARLY